MTFYNSDLKILDIEPSSFCNAKCPQCMRESQNGSYDFFNQVNLTDTFFEIFFPKQVVINLEIVSFSGNVGEPTMNKHLIDIIRWFRKQNPKIYVEVYTNGSVQKPKFWSELGEVIGHNGNVIFAIDGLEDTNHIYRIGVKWNLLMQNAKAYIESGAKATWQFIPFLHNEHQVELAKQLSAEMGFDKFKIKISHRDLLNQQQNEKTRVYPPKNPMYTHSGNKLDFTNLDVTENYLNSLDIKCYAIENSNLYISAEGLVFPCCHTASIILLDDNMVPEPYSWIRKTKSQFNLNEINLHNNTLEQILKSVTFNEIKESWNKDISVGKNAICAAICGKCKNNKSLIENLLHHE